MTFSFQHLGVFGEIFSISMEMFLCIGFLSTEHNYTCYITFPLLSSDRSYICSEYKFNH